MRTFAAAMKTLFLISLITASTPADNTLEQELPAITVSALKEQVSTAQVASAVSSISGQTLQKESKYRPNALSSMVPGLHIPDYGASLTSTIYLRGLGSRMENPVMALT